MLTITSDDSSTGSETDDGPVAFPFEVLDSATFVNEPDGSDAGVDVSGEAGPTSDVGEPDGNIVAFKKIYGRSSWRRGLV